MICNKGKAIGSTFIDEYFRQLLSTRLRQIQPSLTESAERAAERTLRGKFERFKCYFGAATGDVDELPLEVQSLKSGSVDFPDVGIRNSTMRLQR